QYDSREANPMATWMADDEKHPDSSPGPVVHYYLDLGDCFGGQWDPDELWRRMGQSYYLDLGYMIADFFTLGLIPRRWDKVHKPPRTLFGYYGPDQFDPDAWRGFYANPAFERMTERDGAWFARIAARFTDEDLDAIARVGDFSDPAQTASLAKAMAERRDIILRRYFGYVSPISDATLDGDMLCAVDLARRTGVYPKQTYRYEARASGQSLAV